MGLDKVGVRTRWRARGREYRPTAIPDPLVSLVSEPLNLIMLQMLQMRLKRLCEPVQHWLQWIMTHTWTWNTVPQQPWTRTSEKEVQGSGPR